MKALIIFLSLVFMGCVTANTRDLSAINPRTESADQSEATSEPPLLVDNDYEECMQRCTTNGRSSLACHCVCSGVENRACGYSRIKNLKPLKLAGFEECRNACVADGYDEDGCRNACK